MVGCQGWTALLCHAWPVAEPCKNWFFGTHCRNVASLLVALDGISEAFNTALSAPNPNHYDIPDLLWKTVTLVVADQKILKYFKKKKVKVSNITSLQVKLCLETNLK